MEFVFEKVAGIISEQLGISVDKITLNSQIIDELGADSLDVVEMIMAFSDEFGVDIPDELAQKMATVGDIVEYLEQNEL